MITFALGLLAGALATMLFNGLGACRPPHGLNQATEDNTMAVMAEFNDALNKLDQTATDLAGKVQAATDAAVAAAEAAHAQDVADTAAAVNAAADAVVAAAG